MKLVLDASVALSWLRLPSHTCSEQAFTILDDLNGEAVLVPQIWPMEVAQGALRVERQQQATAAMLAKFSAVLNSVPVVNESRPSTAWLPQCANGSPANTGLPFTTPRTWNSRYGAALR